MVRVPSSRRGPPAWRVAAWNTGANMKPMRASLRHRSTTSTGASMTTPRASSTSAEPARDDSARLPCLATVAPAAAATIAARVDTLTVPEPSPPVPQVSTARSRSAQVIGSARARIALAAPAISSAVSPFMRRAMSRPPICAGVACPSMIAPNTWAICSRDRSRPPATWAMAWRMSMSWPASPCAAPSPPCPARSAPIRPRPPPAAAPALGSCRGSCGGADGPRGS